MRRMRARTITSSRPNSHRRGGFGRPADRHHRIPWNFYEDRGQPLFLAPTSKPRLRIEGEITCFEGEVSAEAAGIIATLFTFSHLSFQFRSSFLSDGYERLHAYVCLLYTSRCV